MNKLLVTLMFAAAFTVAHAGTQQDKMTSCNAEAKTKQLKDNDRKAFMKDCLTAKPPVTGNSQQGKMKTCNADAQAKALQGDERKAFMKSCLSS